MNQTKSQGIVRQRAAGLLLTLLCVAPVLAGDLTLHALDYLDTQGLSVLAYQNTFHPVFRDQKMGGVEIILHGERIATGGEVRLQATPEQWDPVPLFTARNAQYSATCPAQLVVGSQKLTAEVLAPIEAPAK